MSTTYFALPHIQWVLTTEQRHVTPEKYLIHTTVQKTVNVKKFDTQHFYCISIRKIIYSNTTISFHIWPHYDVKMQAMWQVQPNIHTGQLMTLKKTCSNKFSTSNTNSRSTKHNPHILSTWVLFQDYLYKQAEERKLVQVILKLSGSNDSLSLSRFVWSSLQTGRNEMGGDSGCREN